MATSFQAFRSLVENSLDPISVIGYEGEILYGNASNIKVFGYPPDELVGRNCLDLIHPEDRENSRQAFQQVFSEGDRLVRSGSSQWIARVLRKDGDYLWMENTGSPLLPESNQCAIVVQQRDISDRKASEERSRREADELARSKRRLEEFAYTAAHDLLEPLRAVSAFTEMLVRRIDMDEDARQIAGFVVNGAARMTLLVEDLLSFAQSGARQPAECVDLKHALAQALQNLAPAILVSGGVVTVDELGIVQSNESDVVRLFQNLISNAVKYRSARPLRIHISAEQRKEDLRIKVQDNGLGIAAEDQARIFMPFERLVNRDVPGSGLGLSVCRKIVQGLGGTIWVESEVGAGSTFSFTLPAEGSASPAMG